MSQPKAPESPVGIMDQGWNCLQNAGLTALFSALSLALGSPNVSIPAVRRGLMTNRLFAHAFGGFDRATVGVHLNVDRNLNGSPIGRGFLSPLTDHPSRVVERNTGGAGCSLGDAHHCAHCIPSHGTHRCSDHMSHSRARLARVRDSRPIGIGGAAD